MENDLERPSTLDALNYVLQAHTGVSRSSDSLENFIFSEPLKALKADSGVDYPTLVSQIFENKMSFDQIYHHHFGRLNETQGTYALSYFERIYLRLVRILSEYEGRSTGKYVVRRSVEAQVGVKFVVSANINTGQFSDIPADPLLLIEGPHLDVFSRKVIGALHVATTPLQEQRKQMLLKNAFGSLARVRRRVRETSLYCSGNKNRAGAYLDAVELALEKELLRLPHCAPCPIRELIGRPGMGKTMASRLLSCHVAAFCPEIAWNERIYFRTATRWWDGYCGQPIVVYDDLGHRAKGGVDVLGELVAIGSGVFDYPPMAFDKETRFTSSFCLVTSNQPIVCRQSSKVTAEALRRRMHSSHVTPFFDSLMTWVPEESKFRFGFSGTLCTTIKSQDGASPLSFMRPTERPQEKKVQMEEEDEIQTKLESSIEIMRQFGIGREISDPTFSSLLADPRFYELVEGFEEVAPTVIRMCKLHVETLREELIINK